MHVLSLILHVGRHRRSLSLFAETSSSSSLGDLCTGQISDIDIRHQHQTLTSDIGGLVAIMGDVSEAPEIE